MGDNSTDENNMPKFMVHVANLPKSGMTINLQANEDELKKIARHMGADRVEKFSCLISFARWAKDGVKVNGEFDVLVHTPSPISLEPVAQRVDTGFAAKYVPTTSKLAKSQFNENGEIIINIDDEDTPDIYEGEELNAWAIAVEYALLEIDPFARLEGEAFDQAATVDDNEGSEISPFSVLNKLKN